MSDLILKCEGVGKRYRDGGLDVPVLYGLDLEIRTGKAPASSALRAAANRRCCIFWAGWICRLKAGCC